MTTQEANRTIAEYMGGPYIGDACIDSVGINDGKSYCTTSEICERCEEIESYYLSLDRLVPVWEKLDFMVVELFARGYKDNKGAQITCLPSHLRHYDLEGKTIQEAACIATAKAIESLLGEK